MQAIEMSINERAGNVWLACNLVVKTLESNLGNPGANPSCVDAVYLLHITQYSSGSQTFAD